MDLDDIKTSPEIHPGQRETPVLISDSPDRTLFNEDTINNDDDTLDLTNVINVQSIIDRTEKILN